MKYLTLIITVPFALFSILFAVSNLGDVNVSLWPFDGEWTIGIYLLGLGMLGAGFLLGGLFVAVLSQRTKFKYWQERRKSERLEKELSDLVEKLKEQGMTPSALAQLPNTANDAALRV